MRAYLHAPMENEVVSDSARRDFLKKAAGLSIGAVGASRAGFAAHQVSDQVGAPLVGAQYRAGTRPAPTAVPAAMT